MTAQYIPKSVCAEIEANVRTFQDYLRREDVDPFDDLPADIQGAIDSVYERFMEYGISEDASLDSWELARQGIIRARATQIARAVARKNGWPVGQSAGHRLWDWVTRKAIEELEKEATR